MFNGIWRDLMFAARSLAQARALTLVCVVSLGIGMALVIAIPYWARVLRLPPVGVNTERLVELITTPRGTRGAGELWSFPDFETLRDADTGVAMIGWRGGEAKIALETPTGVRAESVAAIFVSANYFRTIGVPLARGAGFDQAADDPLAAAPVVILGYDYWQNNMAADPDIIGKTLTLDDIPHLVVGVAPQHFSGHLGFQERRLFLPLGRYAPLRTDPKMRADRSHEWLSMHGRLAPGVSIAQASAAVATITARLAAQYPATNELKAGIVVPYDPLGYLNEFNIIETVAFTLTGAVLVVVCLNISGMMLVRSAMRERELSIRSAIGASRGRLAQYLLSEAIVLAALGAVLGSVLILNAPPVVAWWNDRPLPYEIQEAIRLDPSIIAFCGALCLATSLVFGLLPAARFSRPAIISSLKDDAGVGGIQAGRVHRWAAALQVAIAMPLVVLCGIAVERVRATATGDLGFASDLLYAAPLRFDDLPDGNVEFRIRSARANLEKASGVASVTIADRLPLDGSANATRISVQRDATAAPAFITAFVTRVGDGYLDTMGIPLLRGRGFTVDDGGGAELVTVISKALADKLFPHVDAGEAVGQRLTVDAEARPSHTLTIIGVTGDFPTSRMSTNREQLLLPLAQHPSTNVFLVARSVPGESAVKLTAALDLATRALGPNTGRTVTFGNRITDGRFVTGVQLRQNSIRDFLSRSATTGGAGGVILILAAIGIYGVVGLMVATRTREIAVRVAIGASRRRVLSMILVDVVKLVVPGVAVGLLLAVAVSRLPVNAGIQLSTIEPLAYVAGAAIVVLVAVLASITHARRAASVDPMVAMRST
jgi:putative ABC transport system permease protein